jgi:hypothetical protein
MNLEELLRESLEEHSATPPDNSTRRAEVQRRIARRRRTRIGAPAAVVTVMVAGAAVGVVALRPDGSPPRTVVAGKPTPVASPTPSQPPPIPEYSNGYHRIADQQLTLPGRRSLALTYTPTSLDFTIGLNCAGVPGQLLELAVNGHRVGTQDCGTASDFPRNMVPPDFQLAGPDMDAHYDSWSEAGVRVGERTTFTVTVGTEVPGRNGGEPSIGAPSASGVVYAGVYLPVPFDQYPFPPRPDTLADLDAQQLLGTGGFGHQLGLLDSRQRPAPNGSYSVTLTMPRFLDVDFCAVAPGRVRVLVNGQQIGQLEVWNWAGGCRLISGMASDAREPARLTLKNIHSGRKVTVTVVTSDFAVPGWRVGFDQSPG